MEEFTEKYGAEVLVELFDTLNYFGYNSCDDDLCDDEGCRLSKAFKAYLKYR